MGLGSALVGDDSYGVSSGTPFSLPRITGGAALRMPMLPSKLTGDMSAMLWCITVPVLSSLLSCWRRAVAAGGGQRWQRGQQWQNRIRGGRAQRPVLALGAAAAAVGSHRCHRPLAVP